MKKQLCYVLASVVLFALLVVSPAHAEGMKYTVKSGDTMWKIAVRYEVGLSEIIAQNPQVANPAMIYPGQTLNIPDLQSVKNLENEVIRLTNIERAKNGLQPLMTNWELSRVARYKSQDMVDNNYFSHTSPVYGSPFKMMKDFGLSYTTAGENIAMGQRSPQEVVNAWMNSSGHRRNILNSSYNQIGVGLATNSQGRLYWTQHFIKSNW